jgi:hypothetical protein
METKIYNDPYMIMEVKKGLTDRGSNYFEIKALDKSTGEIVECSYFGNTTPKRVLKIVEYTTKVGTSYLIAVIQPHTSRDKKTGRFISGKRRTI